MVPWCHGQHDQPGMEPAPWVEHWVSSQMPLFLRSLLFIGSDVHKRSIDPPSARLRSVLQLPLVAPSPRLDHQSRSSIAMFTVFLSHNEICSRHHFSPVTLKVWQNFHTEVSSSPTPLCSVSKTATNAPLYLPLSATSPQSISLKDSNLDSINFYTLLITQQSRRCSINQLVMSVDWRELSKSIDASVSSF